MRPPRRTVLAAAAAALAVVVVVVVATAGESTRARQTTSTVPPPPPAVGSEQYGANVNWLFNAQLYTPAQIDERLSELRATGATIARSDALWEATEPTPPSQGVHRYDWVFDDRIALSLASHGLRWLPIIDYSAPWAQSIPGRDHSPPRSLADYAAYAGALAGRYGAGGGFWREHSGLPALPVDAYEIWNEPDNPTFWVHEPDANLYAQLYTGARNAIAAVDPTARVLVGGLTNPGVFLPAMLAADPRLRSEIGGVAIHPYAPTPEGVLAKVRIARDVLNSLGLVSVPLYVTEFGWTTSPPGVLNRAPASLRPGYIERTLALLGQSGCGVTAALLYTWVTPQLDATNGQDWYGIDPPGGGGSPSVDAFEAGLRTARGEVPARACG